MARARWIHRFRSAVTGRFVPRSEAEQDPGRSVDERVRRVPYETPVEPTVVRDDEQRGD
jgi:hypothetical protein